MTHRSALLAAVPALALLLAAAPRVLLGGQEGSPAGADGAAAASVRVERTIDHLGRPARLSFDVATRELVVVGEAHRPLVFGKRDGEEGVWFTTIGDLRAAPDLDYVLREQGRRAFDLTDRRDPELPAGYYGSEDFALVPVHFGPRAVVRVNANPGDTDIDDPAHYRTIDAADLRAYLLVTDEHRLDLVIPEKAFDGRIFPGEMLGDGSPERSHGVRADLVLSGVLDLLPPRSLEWLGPIDANARAIERYRRPAY
ncbi:MAG: hypothetical protein R3F34_19170 [Planctomycetota bacterium]